MFKGGMLFFSTGLLGLSLLLPRPAAAAWPTDPLVNVPLCTATGDQYLPTSVSDGAGGAIVAWYDLRNGNRDIYAQRISAAGTVQWTANGVALCTATGQQYCPTIAADGTGGAIITWFDGRSGTGQYDIYAQRISAGGTVQWTADGVALCTATSGQWYPTIVADGAGGAIVTWTDYRRGNADIYAQRISAAGTVQWTANGVALCTATDEQVYPTIVADGAGGAIVTWGDQRSGAGNWDIYAQRISAAGVVQWAADGVALCSATGGQDSPAIASDGGSGAIVTWWDYRSGNYDIYAQRILASGAINWAANGVALCSATGWQGSLAIIPDGAGGAIVTWDDDRSSNWDIYAQKIAAAGTVQWTANGVALCTATGDQQVPTITSDGAAGAIVTWQDQRSGSNYDIYAQRILAGGTPQWTANGVALCTATGSQDYPSIISDGAAGAIVSWRDARNGNADVYAQRVGSTGQVGRGCEVPGIQSVKDVPMDQGGKVLVLWSASCEDSAPTFSISAYTLWRRVTTVAAQQALARGAQWVRGADLESGPPREGAIRMSSEGAEAVYWEFIASIPARGVSGYGYTVTTTTDSMPGVIPYNVFFVDAKEASSSAFFVSNPDSGYSVDNLAPVAPTPFTGSYAAGTTRLHWGPNAESDFKEYSIYRSAMAGGPFTRIATKPDTGYADAGSAGSYYRLTAFDVHGNESGFALLTPGNAVGVGDAEALSFALETVRPNPTHGERLSIDFILPRAGTARLELLDVAGRRVVGREVGSLGIGRHQVDLASGARLVPGLYLVRLTQGANTRTKRVAVLN